MPRRIILGLAALLAVAVAASLWPRPAPLPPRGHQVPRSWAAGGWQWREFELLGNEFLDLHAGPSGLWSSVGRPGRRGLLADAGSHIYAPHRARPQGFRDLSQVRVRTGGLAFVHQGGVGIWDFGGNQFVLSPGRERSGRIAGLATAQSGVYYVHRPLWPLARARLVSIRSDGHGKHVVRRHVLPLRGQVSDLIADVFGQLWLTLNPPGDYPAPLVLRFDPAGARFHIHYPFPDPRPGDPPLRLGSLAADHYASVWALAFTAARPYRLIGIVSLSRDDGAPSVMRYTSLPVNAEQSPAPGTHLAVTPGALWFSVGLSGRPWDRVVPSVWEWRTTDGSLTRHATGPPQRGKVRAAALHFDGARLWAAWGRRIGTRTVPPSGPPDRPAHPPHAHPPPVP